MLFYVENSNHSLLIRSPPLIRPFELSRHVLSKQQFELSGVFKKSITQKMKFSIKGFFCNCDQICSLLENWWCIEYHSYNKFYSHTACLMQAGSIKNLDQKITGVLEAIWKITFVFQFQKEPTDMFQKFTRKHLCQSLFFNIVAVLRHET